jgi:hypothetical protein
MPIVCYSTFAAASERPTEGRNDLSEGKVSSLGFAREIVAAVTATGIATNCRLMRYAGTYRLTIFSQRFDVNSNFLSAYACLNGLPQWMRFKVT